MNNLIGKTIREIWLQKEKDLLGVFTDEGWLYYITTGDCCTNCSIYHWEGIDALLDNEVTDVELVAGDSIGDRKSDDVEDIHFVKFITSAGRSTLEFRAHHNGYYGGWIEPLTDNNGMKPYVANDFPTAWIRILEDF